MAITRKSNFITEAILDEAGQQIGELRFNPHDPGVYQRLISLIARLNMDSQTLRKLDMTGLELDFSEAADLEATNASLEQVRQAMDTTVGAIDEVIAGLDEIFGAGVCALFLQGTRDPQLLQPLLAGVLPYFQTARGELLKKYQAKPREVGEEVLEA